MGGYQLIDLFLATMHVMDIGIDVVKVGQGEASKMEEEEIAKLKPVYNIQSTGNIYTCLCDPTKSYKTRKGFEKHMNAVHREELDELTIQQAEERE